MRTLTLVATLLLVGAQTSEPPVLPPGQFCAHVTARDQHPAHPCACHRECLSNIELGEDGKPHETITVKEDAQCKQWCHADHCHCPAKGCE